MEDTDTGRPADPRLPQLVAALDGTPEARAAAEQTLRAIGPQVVPDLAALAANPPKSPAARRSWALHAALLLSFVGLLVSANLSRVMAGVFGLLLIPMAILLAVDVVAGARAQKEARRWQVRMLRALALYDDARVVDPLLKLLQADYDSARGRESGPLFAASDRHVAEAHVVRLLGSLPAAEAKDRLGKARRALYWPLEDTYDIGPNADVIETLCAFIVQVHDLDALPIVEKLARAEAATPNEKRARSAAQRCLAALEPVREARRNQATLLRPCTSADSNATVLMRPAGPGADAPDRLLRPADGDEK